MVNNPLLSEARHHYIHNISIDINFSFTRLSFSGLMKRLLLWV